jgi:hypothetical protein
MFKTKLHAELNQYCPEIINSFATEDEINFNKEAIILCKFLIRSVCSKTIENFCFILSEAIFYLLDDIDAECLIPPEIILKALHRIAAKEIIIEV